MRKRTTCATISVKTFIVILGLFGIVAVSTGFQFYSKSSRLPSHTAVLVVSRPVRVFHYNYDSKTLVTIELPFDITIDAAYGYGEYTLDAIWKLDRIEKRDGELFRTSVEHALGMPIPYIVYDKNLKAPSEFLTDQEPRYLLNVQALLTRFQGNIKTNMSYVEFFDIVRLFSSTSVEYSRMLRVGSDLIYQNRKDSEVAIKRFDRSRFDALFSSWFEDAMIRNEAKTIAIYNTTNIPGLAGNLERTMTRAGAIIHTVDNEEIPRNACELYGEEEHIESETSKFLQSYINCDIVPVNTEKNESAADLIVWIGDQYAKEYLPFDTAGK